MNELLLEKVSKIDTEYKSFQMKYHGSMLRSLKSDLGYNCVEMQELLQCSRSKYQKMAAEKIDLDERARFILSRIYL